MTEMMYITLQAPEKDIWDYIGICAPIVLSVVAILISMWNSFWSRNLKRLEADMVWEDIRATFFIVIRNTGKKTLVIDSVSLEAYDKKEKRFYELGTRENAWSVRQRKGYILENEMMVISPIYGSIYDVFAYKGHAFDVTDDIRNLSTYIKIIDIEGKWWKFRTPFTLGEIDDKLQFATTVE